MSHKIDSNNIASRTSTEEEPQVLEFLEQYLATHLKTGSLIFQVFQNSPLEGILPITNAKVTLCKSIGEGYFISKIYTTDENGKTETIALPTVSASLSQSPDNDEVYSTYDAYIEAPGFLPANIIDIPIFEGITTIQPVNLLVDFQAMNLPKPASEKKQSL